MKKNEFFLDVLYDFAGCFVFALGLHSFTVPNHLAPGGVSGISTIINFFTGFPVGTISLLINIPLLLLALKILGKEFTFKTLKTVIISTFMIDIVMLPIPVYVGNVLLASVYGGIFMGIGLGIIFSRGSTTGGSDIVMRLLKLKYPHMSMGTLLMSIDMLVVLLSVVAFGNVEVGLYGVICIFCCSKAIDFVVLAGDKGKTVLVFSTHNEEIADRIMSEVSRGVTYLRGVGAYTMEEKNIILCAVHTQEFVKLKQIVSEIDPQAFVIVSDSDKIYGNGFKDYTDE